MAVHVKWVQFNYCVTAVVHELWLSTLLTTFYSSISYIKFCVIGFLFVFSKKIICFVISMVCQTLCLMLTVAIYCSIVITYADGRYGATVYTAVCLSVCLSFFPHGI